MPDTHALYRQSAPDENPAFRRRWGHDSATGIEPGRVQTWHAPDIPPPSAAVLRARRAWDAALREGGV